MKSADEDLPDKACLISSLPACYYEEETVYEMKYTAGANMWDFWLSEVKLVKTLEWWRSRITTKVMSFELEEAKEISTDCIVIALLPSGVAIRARVIAEIDKDELGNYYPFLLDIDTGEIMRVYVDVLYVPDEEIMRKKPFAVNCCLNIRKSIPNHTFLQNISKDVVKVLFKRITLSSPPKYVVSVSVKRKDEYVDIVSILNAGKGNQETVPSIQKVAETTEKPAFKYEGFTGDGKNESQDGRKVILDVQVSHLDSLSRFYLWESLDQLKLLKSLIAEMKTFYKSDYFDESGTFYETLSPGDPCAALDPKDLNWYRAKVLNHSKTTDFKGLVQKHYEVLFVDFGSQIEVPCSFLRPLEAEFFKEPVFAKRCHLFGVKPAPGFESSDGLDYSEDIIEIFEGFLQSGKLTLVEAPNSESDPPDSIPVILERNYKGSDYVINLELLGQRLVTSTVLDVSACNKVFESAASGNIDLSNHKESAAKSDYVKSRGIRKDFKTVEEVVKIKKEAPEEESPEKDLREWNPMEDDYANNDITYENVVTDDASALIGYQATDEARICKFFARTGRCYKGASCKKEHKYLRPDGITTDTHLVPGKVFSYLSLPKPGSDIKLRVMCLSDATRFYAVLVDAWKYKETACEFIPNEKFEDDTLDNLIDHINSKESLSKLRRLVMPPGVGEIVLSKMKSVNSFYRAQVMDTNLEDNEFEVLYVDVGITDWVHAKNLRQIENEFLHLPFQAVECELACYGVPQEADGHRKIQVRRKLLSMISFKELNAHVVRSFTSINKLVVDLYDDSGLNVGDELERLGYLVKVRDIYENCLGLIPG
ncbi:uncharacterized protein LOC124169330 isoform X2 [Ischnura elegans]|uniref:uncharacterized protein LOC124169330 isoform X2 n=1 Tax=Ischnura elegans TaxID=197161 RepID=UPI001ED89910|nr:uncharacterized protein LOC124169330 isoform X2 [Ischnura elegans]